MLFSEQSMKQHVRLGTTDVLYTQFLPDLSIIKNTISKCFKVETPPLEQYLQLYFKYSQTLKCACTKISINYEIFFRINYTLHQVCNSIFVTKQWIDHYIASSGKIFFTEDFRSIGPYTFQAWSTFCELINQTISDSLSQLYSNQYISASVTSLQLLLLETESLRDQFQSSMTNRFLLSHSMIRKMTQLNDLFFEFFLSVLLCFNINMYNSSIHLRNILIQQDYSIFCSTMLV